MSKTQLLHHVLSESVHNILRYPAAVYRSIFLNSKLNKQKKVTSDRGAVICCLVNRVQLFFVIEKNYNFPRRLDEFEATFPSLAWQTYKTCHWFYLLRNINFRLKLFLFIPSATEDGWRLCFHPCLSVCRISQKVIWIQTKLVEQVGCVTWKNWLDVGEESESIPFRIGM